MRDKGFTRQYSQTENATRGIPCVIYADRWEQKDSLGNIHREYTQTDEAWGIPLGTYTDRWHLRDSFGNIRRQVRPEGFPWEYAQKNSYIIYTDRWGNGLPWEYRQTEEETNSMLGTCADGGAPEGFLGNITVRWRRALPREHKFEDSCGQGG